jgi:hypothetical protein
MKLDKLDYFTRLQSAIRQAHNCEAFHNQTVYVHEILAGATVWKGEVEVFNLEGHAKAKKCYAWEYNVEGSSRRVVTVLERQMINSAGLAVKAAIFFDVHKAPHPSHSEA